MLCSLVHVASRILDHPENTTSQRAAYACMWSKLEVINIVMFHMNFNLITFKLAWFCFLRLWIYFNTNVTSFRWPWIAIHFKLEHVNQIYWSLSCNTLPKYEWNFFERNCLYSYDIWVWLEVLLTRPTIVWNTKINSYLGSHRITWF